MDRNKNGRWNWYGEGEEDSNENNCYKGKFWNISKHFGVGKKVRHEPTPGESVFIFNSLNGMLLT